MFKKIKDITIFNKYKNKTAQYWKKYITKKAIEKVKIKIAYQQKKPSDYTIDEMRGLIDMEKKVVLSELKNVAGMGTIFALLGIPSI
jgi:hypothetical protein|tara:strand:+ start:265 stop:525 length:261 start_codon:yes stop_codon:yes gene_type:complete